MTLCHNMVEIFLQEFLAWQKDKINQPEKPGENNTNPGAIYEESSQTGVCQIPMSF